MIVAVGVREGMQGVIGIHAEFVGRNEDGAGGAQGNVAAAVFHRAGAHGGGGVVARARDHLDAGGNAQQIGDFRLHFAHHLIAFKQLGHLIQPHVTNLHHFLGPGLVLHVQQQDTGSIGIIAGVHAGQPIIDVILGQHDLGDPAEILRLILLHPDQLGRGKAGKGDVGGILGQFILADHIVQIIHRVGSAAIVPQNGGANHPIVFVQGYQAVHLSAAADTDNAGGVKALQQFPNAVHTGVPPIIGLLLAPAGLRKIQGIFPGYGIEDLAAAIHQQQLYSGSAQVNTNIQFRAHRFPFPPCVHFAAKRLPDSHICLFYHIRRHPASAIPCFSISIRCFSRHSRFSRFPAFHVYPSGIECVLNDHFHFRGMCRMDSALLPAMMRSILGNPLPPAIWKASPYIPGTKKRQG